MADVKDWLHLYGGQDPRAIPLYTCTEAAFCLHDTPASTLRSWAFGGKNFKPVIDAHDKEGRLLSFTNLVEAHVLSAMRKGYRLKMREIRDSIKLLSSQFGVEHPLAHARFMTDWSGLFVKQFGRLVHAGGDERQLLFEGIVLCLERVEWDAHQKALRLFPFPRWFDMRKAVLQHINAPRLVSIDPLVQFGEPVLVGTRIPTAAIAERFFADEPLGAIARDFGISEEQAQAAIRWETPMPKAAA